METHVLSGLMKRRAVLAGDIELAHEKLRQMVADLENLDATIRIFDPSIAPETTKPKAFRPPPDWAHKGELSRLVLSILRQATEPLTSRDIALQMLIERAMDKSDQRLLRLTVKRGDVALRIQRDNGTVQAQQGPGQYQLWEVVR